MLELTGKVVALVGTGSDLDRALAMACAEAGARLALATRQPTQEQEFAMNSIANEAWAVGADQFVEVIGEEDAEGVARFVAAIRREYGRCDVVISRGPAPTALAEIVAESGGRAVVVDPADGAAAAVVRLGEQLGE